MLLSLLLSIIHHRNLRFRLSSSIETSSFFSLTGKMSRRNGPKLELKLNLSPPRMNRGMNSPSRSATVSPTSPPSSCVSDMSVDEGYPSSPEATSMVLVGCPRCLMYVMLSEDDPKCPKCKSTVLLDFLHETAPGTTCNTRKN